MKNILILFGGKSPEHEVSIITGLQVVENLDKELFSPIVIYVDKNGIPLHLSGINSKKEFFSSKRSEVKFGKDNKGGFIEVGSGLLGSKKVHIDAAYLAFHGGQGEGGAYQGMMELLGIPYSSSSVESSVLTMNKSLAKTVLIENHLPSVAGISLAAEDVRQDVESAANQVEQKLSLPVIIKPAHFGSSIGIGIAKTRVELEKQLSTASMIDSEILVEKLLSDFIEYNVSVRVVDNKVEVSEIEKPLSQDEILSFADKYERGGGKKSGGDGMASLQRELPADIPDGLKDKIQSTAKAAFKALKCKGLVRIDFMVVNEDELYITEVNSIPGSMSYYLWEASGVDFRQQITDLLTQAELDFEKLDQTRFDHSSEIVSKFVKS